MTNAFGGRALSGPIQEASALPQTSYLLLSGRGEGKGKGEERRREEGREGRDCLLFI